jgi:hypothetical protein
MHILGRRCLSRKADRRLRHLSCLNWKFFCSISIVSNFTNHEFRCHWAGWAVAKYGGDPSDSLPVGQAGGESIGDERNMVDPASHGVLRRADRLLGRKAGPLPSTFSALLSAFDGCRPFRFAHLAHPFGKARRERSTPLERFRRASGSGRDCRRSERLCRC